jgi:4-hydroxy-4-methyl-2-oxoglutarate aldolase
MVGPAFPVQIRTVNEVPDQPYLGLLAAVDAVSEGDVYIAAVDGEGDVAIWGELIGTACRTRGAVGSICDGYSRDTRILRSMRFPVFCRGTVPTDSNGRSEVVSHGVPVVIDGVQINPGDHIVADDDGVVIVPQAISAEVFQGALDKGESESDFRRAVTAGMSAVDAFRKFGVL